MKWLSPRAIYFYQFVLCCVILTLGLYFQAIYRLEPCPLCIVQRIIFLFLALLYFSASLYVQDKKGRRIYNTFLLLLNLVGAAVAGRHMWLQTLPPNSLPNACGADFTTLFANLPAKQAIRMIFYGSGECARETWEFLHFTMPTWAFIFFSFFVLLALWQIQRKH